MRIGGENLAMKFWLELKIPPGLPLPLPENAGGPGGIFNSSQNNQVKKINTYGGEL